MPANSATVLIVLGTLGALACMPACMEDTPETTCKYGGVEHRPGDSFPSTDGCNTCTCGDDGQVACTTRACVTSCTYAGIEHAVGTTFPATDGCNSCSCGEDGNVACTAMACVVTCDYEGATHQVGDEFPASDGCNTCTCEAAGTVSCTEIACPQTCTYDRRTWNVGDTFPAIDGCNTCTCMAGGQLSCTEKNCQCDPDSEWWRWYAARSPEECAAVDYRCVEWTTSFSNACGCGCEQAAECAQEIECFFPECQNASELQAKCPYSTVDTTRDCSAELACPSDGSFCNYPGQDIGCGICMNPPEETTCASDEQCGAGSICEPLRCACQGQRVCVPGCTGDSECGEGQMCGDGARCVPRSCGPDAACPANFRCDGGGCLRIACAASAECQGYCVDGQCYAEPGSCLWPVP